MLGITVFSTAASFLSFTSVRETSSMPKLEDVVWGSNVATSPLARHPKRYHVPSMGNNADYAYDIIVANYLILSVENDRFCAAYVAFPGRSNFDKATKIFLGRYGKPNESDLAIGGRYWIGNDLSIRLQYEPNTEEGILAVTCQGGRETAQVSSSRTPPQA